MNESWFSYCYVKSELTLDSSWRYKYVNCNSPILIHMHNNTAPINITRNTNELGKGVFSSANMRSCKSIVFNSYKQSNTSGGSFTLDVQNYGSNNTYTDILKVKHQDVFPTCSLLPKKCSSYIALNAFDSLHSDTHFFMFIMKDIAEHAAFFVSHHQIFKTYAL